MAQTAFRYLSEGEGNGQPIEFDNLHTALLTVHIALVAYVTFGWLVPSRPWLYFYALLLPTIVMQWLLNGGCSIVNNVENLLRVGQWSDPQNGFEGAFFRTLLERVGIRPTQAQINTALCSLMLIFWVCAISRMMLIVSSA